MANWESQGLLRGIVTQNIDGLHEVAGHQPENILELHGTARSVGCIECDYLDGADTRVREFLESGVVPHCPNCSAPLKHATVSFGQSLSPAVLEAAVAWSQECELFLAMGSSLVVHPAADLPRIAQSGGGRLVIINRDATPLDDIADIVIRSSLGEALQAINAELGPP